MMLHTVLSAIFFAFAFGAIQLGLSNANGQGVFVDGTKWCGAGNHALSFKDIGTLFKDFSMLRSDLFFIH